MKKVNLFIAILCLLPITQLQAQVMIDAPPGTVKEKPDSAPSPHLHVPNTPASANIHPCKPGVAAPAALFDSVYSWTYDTIKMRWYHAYEKEIDFVYDSHANLLGYTIQIWNGSGWENYHKYSYTFDGDNNEATGITQYWKDKEWQNVEQDKYTYNSAHQKTMQLISTWKGGAWVNAGRNVYEYNSAGQQTVSKNQPWYGNAWASMDEFTYTFDRNNNETHELYRARKGRDSTLSNFTQASYTYNPHNLPASGEYETWRGNDWVKQNTIAYTYDSDGRKTIELNLNWRDAAWQNANRMVYTYYPGGNVRNETKQLWSGSDWVSKFKQSWTYNSDNLETNHLEQRWKDSVLINVDQYNYTYNSPGYETGEVYQAWKDNAWQNARVYTWTYNSGNYMLSELYRDWSPPLLHSPAGGSGRNYSMPVVETDNTTNYTYDKNNVLLSETNKTYNVAENKATHGDSTRWYFHKTAGAINITASKGKLTIPLKWESRDMYAEVFDASGRKVYQTKIPDYNRSVTLSLDVPDGLYMVSLKSMGEETNEDFVVQQ